jgi:RHS repeat-associated protein
MQGQVATRNHRAAEPTPHRAYQDHARYDANGNMTQMPLMTMSYDVANRMVSSDHSSQGATTYRYNHANQRIYMKTGTKISYFLYGLGGERLLEMEEQCGGNCWNYQETQRWIYFAGRKMFSKTGTTLKAITPNRLASEAKHFPYGETDGTPPSDTKDYFATYRRDGTGLDYAWNRYYSPTMGRFTTADPSEPFDLENPGSFNLFGYVLDDPISFIDPEGLDVKVSLPLGDSSTCGAAIAEEILAHTPYGLSDKGAHNLFNSKEGILALSVFFETRPSGNYDLFDEDGGFYQAILGVANVYLNRWLVDWGGSRRNQVGFKQAIMDASTPIWERYSPKKNTQTNRNLRTSYVNQLSSILRGGKNDSAGNCKGLIFSFVFAQNFIKKNFGPMDAPSYSLKIYPNVGSALYFHSYNDLDTPKVWGKGVDYWGTFWTPKFPKGYKPFHFFVKRGVTVDRTPFD